MKRTSLTTTLPLVLAAAIALPLAQGCKPANTKSAVTGDAASKVFVPPGQYDEFYSFVSGGFSGQMSVYGIPSGRLLRVIPVFSVDPEKGWGYSEETKPMLMTTHGFIPWDDSHHVEASMSDGIQDGKFMFINGNNTPRIAMIDLKTFRTSSIIEIPNSAGNHSSPFSTPNSEYIVAGTRFSIPMGTDAQRDVPIETYKENFKSTVSFIKPDTSNGSMKIAFQIKTPAIDIDLSHSGKGPSDGWFFFTCYNTEKAHTLLEVNATQNDKDFIMAVNWKKCEEYVKAGKGKKVPGKYYNNALRRGHPHGHLEDRYRGAAARPEGTHGPRLLHALPQEPARLRHGPHRRITSWAAASSPRLIPVFSFDKMQKAIADKDYEGDYRRHPGAQV